MDIFVGAITLAFFACVWIGGVCWVLGFIQKNINNATMNINNAKTEKSKLNF